MSDMSFLPDWRAGKSRWVMALPAGRAAAGQAVRLHAWRGRVPQLKALALKVLSRESRLGKPQQDAILQPPRPQIQPSERVPERVTRHDLNRELAD